MRVGKWIGVALIVLVVACGGGDTGPSPAPPPPPPPPPPPAPVASVLVTLAQGSILAGGTVQASATPRDANGSALSGRTVAWSTSNPAVATVNTLGLVTTLAPGTVSVQATSEQVTGSATLTVTAVPVASILLSSPQTTLTVGATTQVGATLLSATGATLTGRAVAWSSSNQAAATVSQTGLVLAVAEGAVTITATSEGIAAGIGLTIAPVAVASVSVTPQTAALVPGQGTTLIATVRDAGQNVLTNRPVVWTSSQPAVATVLQTGQVTAIAPGTTTISATSGGQVGTATITVTNVAVASVTLNLGNQTIAAGDVRVLIATARDAGGNVLSGRAVSWTSSNLNIVSGYVFADTAVVTGLAAGAATVSATVEGKSASVVFQVLAPPPSICTQIAGASVFGDDGQYLGRFTNRFDSQSILNEFGNYGSPYSSTSTNNTYGQYGSPYSSLSARNPYASRPPIIVKNGAALAYYTTNQFKTPSVSPAYALTCNFP